MRSQFISTTDNLVIHYIDREIFVVDSDKPLHNVVYALEYCEHDVVRFNRVDKNFNSEDVTELIAWAWLNNNGEHPDDMKISGRGPWLENSRALEEYIENYDDERSDFDEHNTLNHTQQGI